MLPFIFDTIFADHHSSQKNSNNMAMKERLEHILKVNKREGGKIFVELINVKNSESHKEQGNGNRQQTGGQHETSDTTIQMDKC